MKAFVNIALVLSFAFQGVFGNISKYQYSYSQASFAESGKLAPVVPVPLFSDTLKQKANESINNKTTIKVKANPQLIIPGVPISIEWTIGGLENAQGTKELNTFIDFPANVKSQEALTKIKANGSGERLTLPSQSSKGQTKFNIDTTKNEDPFLIDVSLNSGDNSIASNSVLMTKPSLEAIAGQNNHLVSTNGKVQLDFPANTLSESLYLDVRDPSPSSISGYSMSGRPMEVVAVGEKTKQNVNKFDSDFTITMTYDLDSLYGGAEDDLSIYYFDEDMNDWRPVPTTVNKETHTLSAQVNHLTVFDYKANSWQASRLPTLDQAQVNGSTGAASYNMSFWLPPAQGGFTPSLSLNYNSQIIDSSTAFTEASWVGAGWTLDTSYIERNMHGTNSDLSDDTFQLVLNGVSSVLLPISTSGSITTYAAEEMNYWKIQFDSSENTWTVKDQSGGTFVFAFTTKTGPSTACVTSGSGLTLTWRWSLTSASDKFNNTITYSYVNQIKKSSSTCLNQVAVYPVYITYPNGRYRIEFNLEDRTDYQSAWEDNDSKVFFQNKRLDYILIEQNTSGTSWNTIRKYDFTYSSVSTNQIYPDYRWTKGGTTAGWTSTLVGVQEISGDGTANLPATTFLYSDKMHVTQINNGQGGTVTFNYERWTYLDDDNDDLWSLYTVFGEDECVNSLATDTSWTAMAGYGTTKCEQHMLQIDKVSSSVGVGLRTFPLSIIKQGAEYQLYILARDIYATTSVRWGFTDPNNQRDIEGELTNVGVDLKGESVSGEMAVNLDPLTTKFIIECDDCYVKKLQFMVMPLVYRVTSQTIADSATGTSGTYTYSYNDGVTNDKTHSAAQNQTGTKYTPIKREYRGFSQTQITNPDGLVTTTWYYQNDLLSGKPYRTLVSTKDLSDEFTSLNTSKWSFSNSGSRQTIGNNLSQETWLRSKTTLSDWSTVTSRSAYSLTDGDVTYSQFKIVDDDNDSGTSTQTEIGIENSAGNFFGLYATPNGSSHDLKFRTRINNSNTDSTLIPYTEFKRNAWYMTMTFVDANDGFHIRVWEKNNPQNYYESSSGALNGSDSWRFTNKVKSGTVLLDSYFEGKPYSETETTYNSSTLYNTLSDSIPDLSSLTDYVDLEVNWTTVSTTISRLFDGDYSWSGTKTTYDYNTEDQGGVQFGNLTRTTQSYWDGSNWVDYRAKLTEYQPNANADLTVLPAREVSLDCASGCDFSTGNGKLAESLYLYDDATSAFEAPSAGKLTATRTWVDGDNYSQTSIGYDDYGNQNSQTSYSGYGTSSSVPVSGTQTTTTAYDSTYHTYAITSTNALNQSTSMQYDFSLGVTISITDANRKQTDATYDLFGRTLKIIAPGDSESSPTLSITYYDQRIPYQVVLNQKVSNNASIRLSRFYSGTGKQIQTQTVGAVVNGTQVNTVVDTSYDIMGRQRKVTVPYTSSYTSSPTFVAQSFTQATTINGYDIYGRQTIITAPNGNVTTYSYDDLTTSVTDPMSRVTTTTNDPFGRVLSVDEPSGPDLVYTYDASDRLISTTKGTGGDSTTISLEYDKAGRKLSLTDPDTGNWVYQYDALGNMLTQTDSRGCGTTLTYDSVNRLTSKSYTGTGACANTASISFYYDQQSFSFLGTTYGGSDTNTIGRLTGMVDGTGATLYTYDDRGRATEQIKKIYEGSGTTSVKSYSTLWTYNSADLPVTMTLPDGEVLTYGYDSQGTPISLTGSNGSAFTYVKGAWYDEAGRLTNLKLGDSAGNPVITKQYSYFGWTASINGGKLQSLVTTNSSSATLQSLIYAYDRASNITSITDTNSGQVSSYTYDELDRVLTNTVNKLTDNSVDFSESFTYDAATGRMLTKASSIHNSGELESFTYDSTHKHAVSSYANNSYTYDENGNQTVRDIGDTSFELVYDAANHLVGASSDEPFATESVNWEVSTPGSSLTPTTTPIISPTTNLTSTDTTLTPTGTITPGTVTPTPTSSATSVPTSTPLPTATLTPSATATPITAQVIGQCGPFTSSSATVTIPSDTTLLVVVEGGSNHYFPTSYTVGGQSLTLQVTGDISLARTRIYYRNLPPTGSQTITLTGFALRNNAAWGCYYLKGTDTSSPIRDSGYTTTKTNTRVTLPGDVVIDVYGTRFTPTSLSYNCSQSGGYISRTNSTGSGYKSANSSSTTVCYASSSGGDDVMSSISIKSAPPATAVPTATSTATVTQTPTNTNTATPTLTSTPTFTATATLTDTPTMTSAVTDTPTLTETPLPTVTETPTETPVPSETPMPTDTETPTDSFVPTDTEIPTETPTWDGTATFADTATETSVPSETPIPSETPLPGETPDVTNTPEVSPTETLTQEVLPTDTATLDWTATETVTITPASSPTPTATPAPQGGEAHYYYDGNGTMVKSVIDDIVTYYPSGMYQEKTDGVHTNVRKYYSFGSTTVAMNDNGRIIWLLQDQVNSTSITADVNGNLLSETRYSTFGEIRYTNGVTVTDKLYTGQQQETELGLDYYVARFYDPQIAHFVQPDSIIPAAGSSKGYDRYSYANSNPIKYTDPSGHKACESFDKNGNCNQSVIYLVCGFGTNGNCNKNKSVDGYNGVPLAPYAKAARDEGYKVKYFDFNGDEAPGAKVRMAGTIKSHFDTHPNDLPIIVGHSAGADASLLAFGNMSPDQKARISGLILLDPTLTAGPDFTTEGSLQKFVVEMLNSKIPIHVADGIGSGSDEASGINIATYLDPGIEHVYSQYSDIYTYNSYSGMNHYALATDQGVFMDALSLLR